MRFPAKSSDMETGKIAIAMHFRNLETAIQGDLNELAMSGFADQRLCAIAKADLEKAFLTLEKAIRLGSPSDYAKQPFPTDAGNFVQRVDPSPRLNSGPVPHIEWRDAKDDPSAQ